MISASYETTRTPSWTWPGTRRDRETGERVGSVNQNSPKELNVGGGHGGLVVSKIPDDGLVDRWSARAVAEGSRNSYIVTTITTTLSIYIIIWTTSQSQDYDPV